MQVENVGVLCCTMLMRILLSVKVPTVFTYISQTNLISRVVMHHGLS